MKWTVEEGGTLGAGGEYTPVLYPRSGNDRALSSNNKEGASRSDDIDSSVSRNNTGHVNVPATLGDVNYETGPYPKFIDDGTEGMDEGDGASR